MEKIIAFCFLVLTSSSCLAIGADNSAINQRDKLSHEYTADQQGDSHSDIKVTQKIRQALMRDKSLSTYAKNIKIITVGGEVTLKGPVRNKDEQNILIQKAQSIAGVNNVFNQTDISEK